MARPVFKKKKKIVRKYGATNGLPYIVGRPGRIGMHARKRESKPSEYKIGLHNKNKLRACYCISEKQFLNVFRRAFKAADTGEALLQDLEFRLDNLVYRLGLVPSLPAARQLVVHGHIEVQTIQNWRLKQEDEGAKAEIQFAKVDRPAYRVKPGQRIKLRQKSIDKKLPVVEEHVGEAERVEYVEFDADSYTGYVTRMPAADEIPIEVEISKIIEFSARKA